MEKLPITKKIHGYAHTQIKRGKKAFIYEQDLGNGIKQYEVFKLKTKPDRLVGGKVLPAKEVFPHDEAFGYWAWCISRYPEALKKFQELENSNKSKTSNSYKSAIKKVIDIKSN